MSRAEPPAPRRRSSPSRAAPSPGAEIALRRARTALSACLPTGSAITSRFADVPPGQRYWLLRRNETLIAVLPQRGELPPIPSLEALRQQAAERRVGTAVTDVAVIGVSVPTGAAWPLAPVGNGAMAPALIARRDKHVVFAVDAASGEARAVIKLPLGKTMGRNCAREYAVLSELMAAGIAVGPRALARDDERGAYGYEYIAGDQPRTIAVPALIDWLGRLRRERTTTPRAEAERYRRRGDALSLPPACRAMLDRWLDRITDTTEIACGTLHGDFAPPNLLTRDQRRFRAIDWEFCEREAIGFLDLIQISHTAEARTAASLPSFFSAEVRRRAMRLWQLAFPAPRPRLDDLLYLSFCLHYINRAEAYHAEDSYRRRLDRLLCNTTPL